jgi:hypothetical protein
MKRIVTIFIAIVIALTMIILAALPVAAQGSDLTVETGIVNDYRWESGDSGPRLDDTTINVGERWYFNVYIAVANDSGSTIDGINVTDNLGDEFLVRKVIFDTNTSEIIDVPAPSLTPWEVTRAGRTIRIMWTGKSMKPHISWDVGSLNTGTGAFIQVVFRTDMSVPNGKSDNHPAEPEFTKAGPAALDSGATATGLLGGYPVQGAAPQIIVDVLPLD